MKTLLTITALTLALGIPTFSIAGENVNTFGVDLPAEKESTRYELKENDLYTNNNSEINAFGVLLPFAEKKGIESKTQYNRLESESSDNYIVIFGVKVPKNIG